ncbi:MAG: tyrosine-type recombinase/integrase [Mailhella sp.]
MGYTKEEMCIHGFRAMASTLLNEMGYRPDVIELQLAHEERNRVRAAYNHSTLLPERTQMMQDWADYLDKLRDGQSSESPHARVVHFVSPKSLKINDFQCISNDCLIKRKKVV